MKRVSITLPNELYEHLAKMENKSEYVRDLIRRELEGEVRPADTSAPADTSSDELSVHIEEQVREHEQRMVKALMLADALNKRTMAEVGVLSKRLNDLESKLVLRTGQTTHASSPPPSYSQPAEPPLTEEPTTNGGALDTPSKRSYEMSPRDEVLACIPKNTPVKRAALESMLSKRFGESVRTLLSELISSGVVSTKVEDGEEAVWK